MNRNSLLLSLFGILVEFAIGNVAREAIIGGRQVTGQRPFRYMVSLLRVDHGHFCGGALISHQHVVTAAHCFIDSDNAFKSMEVFALVGTDNLFDFNYPAVNVKVVKVYVPWEYSAENASTTADIAVLKVKEPVRLTSHSTIKVVRQPRNRFENSVGKKATITGWGWNNVEVHHDHPTGYLNNPILQVAEADVIDNDRCQEEHPTLHLQAEQHLCAKIEQHEHENHGVCYGDDGSPLVHNGTIIGVLSSFPKNCTERTSSAIYTRVNYYLRFLRNAKEDYVPNTMRSHVYPQ